MTIGKDSVVTYHYQLTDAQGTEVESTFESEPAVYLHGYQSILPALESALEGQLEGAKLSVSLGPDQAYGPRLELPLKRVPIKYLQGAKRWRVGMHANVPTEHGTRLTTVVKVGKFSADVDLNHPLAGQTLNFEIEVVSFRPATAEEKIHRHVHHAGGCAH